MLFALDWIQKTYDFVASTMQRFIGGITLGAMESALTGSRWVLIPAIILSLILCFYGFKLHKLVSGLAGGALLGWLGWILGAMLNPSLITVPILYMLLLAILGFFVLYVVYVFNVFAASFLLAFACCAALPQIPGAYALILSLVFAILYCVLYVQDKKTMSALTGGILLGLIAGGLYGAVPGAAVCSACTAGGILLQTLLQKRSDERNAAEEAAQLVKYPYGPGLRDAKKAERLARKNALAQAPVQDAPAQNGGVQA